MGYLLQLADQHNTDKKMADHGYVMMYEKLMEKSRLTTKNLLEIGYGEGGSIKMWADYFPNAQIHCIEYFDDEYKNVWHSPALDVPDLNVIEGDSTKLETWDAVPFDLDYIIDDGSHFPQHQMDTFLSGFSHLKSRGLYFIEDTHCSFQTEYGYTDLIYKWVFDFVVKQQTPGRNYGGNFYQCRGAMEDIVKDVYSYSFYKSIICFEKA